MDMVVSILLSERYSYPMFNAIILAHLLSGIFRVLLLYLMLRQNPTSMEIMRACERHAGLDSDDITLILSVAASIIIWNVLWPSVDSVAWITAG